MSFTDATLVIGNFLTVEGGGSFDSSGNLVLTNAVVFLGQGPLKFSDGTDNPAATGVKLTGVNATVTRTGAGDVVHATGTIAIVGIPGFSVPGSITATIDVNSTSTDSTTPAIAAHTATVTVNTTLTVAGQGVTGNFTFTRNATTGVIGVSATGVTVTLGGGLTISGSAAFVIAASGVAGVVTVSNSPTLNGITLSASLTVTVNSGTAAVTLPGVLTGGSDVAIAGGPYFSVVLGPTSGHSSAQLTVGGQTISGNFAIQSTSTELEIAATNVSLVFADGSGNALVSFTNGHGYVVSETAGGAAGSISGTIAVNVSGVTLGGSLTLTFNTVMSDVDSTFTFGTDSVTFHAPAATSSGGYLKVSGTGLTLSVAGQSLTTDVTFTKSGSTVAVTLANTALSIGDGTATYFTITQNGTAAFLVETVGASQVFAGHVAALFTFHAPAGAPVLLTGAQVDLTINTSTSAVTLPDATVLDAGPSVSLKIGTTGTPAVLTVAGQQLSATVGVTVRTAADTSRTVVLTVQNASFRVGPSASPLLSVVQPTNDTSFFVLTPAGVAGHLALSFNLAATPVVTLAATQLSLDVNTSTTPVGITDPVTLGVPAGPRVTVAAQGLTLTVDGQQLGGDATFSWDATAGTPVITVTATNVGATIGATASDGPRVVLSNGAGTFTLDSSGISGSASGVVSLLGVPGVTFTAAMTLSFSPTSFSITGPVTLHVSSGGTTLVDLAANLSVLRTAAAGSVAAHVTITASNASTTIGGATGPALHISNATLALALFDHDPGTPSAPNPYALYVSGTASLTGVSGFSASGTLSVKSSTLATPYDTGLGVTVAPNLTTIDGSISLRGPPVGELDGSISITRNNGTGETTITGSSLSLLLGTSAFGISASGVKFALLLRADGTYAIRADVTGSVTLNGVTGVTVSAGALFAQRNTTGGDVTLTEPSTTAVTLPAGVDLFGGHLTLAIGSELSLQGDIAIQRTTTGPDGVAGTADDAAELLVGATGVSVSVGVGTDPSFKGIRVSGGTLGLLIGAGGFAFDVSGQVGIVGLPGLTLTGTFGAMDNTFTTAVHRQLTVGSTTVVLNLTPGALKFSGTGITLTVLNQTLTGDFTASVSGSTVSVSVAKGSIALGDGNRTFVGVTDATGTIQLDTTAGTVAAALSGSAAIDIPGVSFTGTVGIEINTGTAGVTVDTTPLDGGPYFAARIGTPTSPATLTVAGQTISGSFLVEQHTVTTTAGTSTELKIAAKNVSVAGDVGVPIRAAK